MDGSGDGGSAVVDALPQAALTLDLDGRVRHANSSASEVLGVELADLAASRLADVVEVQGEDASLSGLLASVSEGQSWTGGFTLTGRPGTPRSVVVSLQPLRDAGVTTGALVLLSDVVILDSSEQLLSERFTRLARVAAELVTADSLEALSKIVTQHMADVVGATVSSLSLVTDDGRMRLVGARGVRAGMMDTWSSYAVDSDTPAGEAVLTAETVLVIGEDELTGRYPSLDSGVDGDRSIVALPLRLGDRVLGAVTMSFPGRRTVQPAELEFLAVMSDTCAQAIERVKVTAEAADRQDKIRFLADSSVELSSTLDYEVTLSKVARLAVPWFADWCSIALDQDGELRTLAVAHVDPAKVALAEEHERQFPADPASEGGAYGVFRSGRSQLIPEIPDELLTSAVQDPDQLDLLRRLNIRSVMTVPLKVGDRVLGVVTWVAGDGGRRFGIDDLAFGEDLAHRAALAIDTAHLHTQLSEVSTKFQRSVLPGELPTVPGWDFAGAYLQAGNSQAGGDFYDVTPLPDGRVAVFVGDVMGRGVVAAAAMAQMRAAVRALVVVEPEPAAVVLALDRLFEQYDFHQLVTLVYAVADPSRDELVIVNAGHPPPVVRRADGTVEILDAHPGLLLGAGGGDRTTTTVPLRPGDAFLGYTDGLVERRGEDIDEGFERLAASCGSLSHRDLDAWLSRVVEDVRDPLRDDDVALVALARHPVG